MDRQDLPVSDNITHTHIQIGYQMLMCFMPQMDAFTLGGAAVVWRYCKQTILIQSTMEVELTTLDIVTTKANWLHDLFMGLAML